MLRTGFCLKNPPHTTISLLHTALCQRYIKLHLNTVTATSTRIAHCNNNPEEGILGSINCFVSLCINPARTRISLSLGLSRRLLESTEPSAPFKHGDRVIISLCRPRCIHLHVQLQSRYSRVQRGQPTLQNQANNQTQHASTTQQDWLLLID